MGMMIDGKWNAHADQTIIDGQYQREASRIDNALTAETLRDIEEGQRRHILLASLSCPWSHRTLLVRAVKSLQHLLPLHVAGGPRVQGYGLDGAGPLTITGQVPRHVHQLYVATEARYTGRVTVPILWDQTDVRILSNDSAQIMRGLDRIRASSFALVPPHLEVEIDALIADIHARLANAVYRAGLAQTQTAYDAAIEDVFTMLDELELRLSSARFLLGNLLTETDLRLFATLVRFDAVYATHFRCTRKRLVDYPSLWAFARDIYALPGVADTVDFDTILEGYYLNDGVNPHGIIAERPLADWTEPPAREYLGEIDVWSRSGGKAPLATLCQHTSGVSQ